MSDTLIPKFIPLYPLLLKDYGIVEASILGYLDFFQCNNKNFNCTNEDLSKILNVSEATIKRSLKNLIKKWEIIVSKKFREWGWQLRIISIAQNGLLQRNNLSFSKGSNWALHNIYNNKEQKELKESGICSVNELLEWYKNHLLLPRMITDISLVELIHIRISESVLFRPLMIEIRMSIHSLGLSLWLKKTWKNVLSFRSCYLMEYTLV